MLINRFVPEHPVKTSEEVNDDVYIFMSIVRNSFTRNRNLRYRVAASPGWQCQFTLIWDRTIISRNEMQAIVIDAGSLVGLSDGRSINWLRTFSHCGFYCQRTLIGYKIACLSLEG